jgi:pimeloyl-ACP methyl ester carboxylesterase
MSASAGDVPTGDAPAGGAQVGATVPGAPRTGEVFVAGVRSPTLEAGPREAEEAAVFVHGNPGSVHDWARLVEAVGAHGRALALDMPGFGEADKPETFNYTVEGYAAHLGGALEQLGISRVHLVLHDFGGAWGLAWAAAHPEAFASVTLIDTGVLIDYRWHALARVWRTPGVGEAFFKITNRSGFRLALRRGQSRPLPEEAIERMYKANKDPETQRAILRLYRATPEDGFQELGRALRQLDRPALVVWGRHDPYIKVEQAERQRETFPSAEVVVLEGSGHWPMWDAPEELVSAVAPFLAKQLGG